MRNGVWIRSGFIEGERREPLAWVDGQKMFENIPEREEETPLLIERDIETCFVLKSIEDRFGDNEWFCAQKY